MNETYHEVDLKEFKRLLNIPADGALEDNLFFKRLSFQKSNKNGVLLEPCRAAGYLAFFCIKGGFTMEINLTTVKVQPNTLIVVIPGNICRVVSVEDEDTDVLLMAASKEFLSSIRMDFMKLFNDSMNILEAPAMTVNEKQIDVLCHYFVLAETLLKEDLPGRSEAVRYLISSVFTYIGEIWTRSIRSAEKANYSKQSLRSKAIFDGFIRLVTEYHNSERGVAFYSDKLSLTPKYLSKLVKTVSGRSAPDWIDSFVILEAKNLLKYSDKPIKEIVFQLNFPNQSVFYKFFKAHTGMTPSEYRCK